MLTGTVPADEIRGIITSAPEWAAEFVAVAEPSRSSSCTPATGRSSRSRPPSRRRSWPRWIAEVLAAHPEAAVDRDDRAGDVRRIIRGDPRHDAGDLVGRRESPGGDVLVFGLGGLGQRRGHVRLDEPGGDDVRGDAACSQLAGE